MTEIAPADVRRQLDRWDAPPWDGAVPEVAFLARGEYSLNFRVGDDHVARLVTGSQMGLPLEEQAPYEHHALQLLEPCGRTPRPFGVDGDPERLPFPVILEGYLPGRPLDYATDIAAAARCVAAIHALGVPAGHRLQTHPEPGPAILAESRELAAPYLEWGAADPASRDRLRRALQQTGESLDAGPAAPRDLAIVNYDLNTHNFVVRDDGEVSLLDWEKARIAPLTQDLAHFLLPTTTLWRHDTATRLSADQEREFVDTYLEHSRHPDPARLRAQLAVMRGLVALRAVSWCAWALRRAADGQRAIVNEETLERSRRYLRPGFLTDLFGL